MGGNSGLRAGSVTQQDRAGSGIARGISGRAPRRPPCLRGAVGSCATRRPSSLARGPRGTRRLRQDQVPSRCGSLCLSRLHLSFLSPARCRAGVVGGLFPPGSEGGRGWSRAQTGAGCGLRMPRRSRPDLVERRGPGWGWGRRPGLQRPEVGGCARWRVRVGWGELRGHARGTWTKGWSVGARDQTKGPPSRGGKGGGAQGRRPSAGASHGGPCSPWAGISEAPTRAHSGRATYPGV